MKKLTKKIGILLSSAASLVLTGSLATACTENTDKKETEAKYTYDEIQCCGKEADASFDECLAQYRKYKSCDFKPSDIDDPGDYCKDCSDKYGMPSTYDDLPETEKISESGY